MQISLSHAISGDRRIKRVSPRDACLSQDFPLHRLTHLLTGELAIDWQAFDIQCIKREYIMLHQRIVPWRAWPVIPLIIAAHVGIIGKPAGIVVQPMPCLRPWRACSGGARLSARGRGVAE